MDKDKLIELLKNAYNDGREDGIIIGAGGVECNDFDDILTEYQDLINTVIEVKQ